MRRGGSSLFATRALPRSLLYDSIGPGFEHATVLGFTLPHSPGPAALAVWEPKASRGAATSAAVNYRSALGFAVPRHQVVKATPFSLRRALSAGSSGGDPSCGGGASSSSSSSSNGEQLKQKGGRGRGGGAGGVAARAAASKDLGQAAEDTGWWHIDVGGYTRKGYQAGGGKEENQDR